MTDTNYAAMMDEIEDETDGPTVGELIDEEKKRRHRGWTPDCDPSQNGDEIECQFDKDTPFPGDDALGPEGI